MHASRWSMHASKWSMTASSKMPRRLLLQQTWTWTLKRRSMRKFAIQRKKNKGNLGEGIPAASEFLVAAKSAYEKDKQAVETIKLAATMEGATAFKL